MTRAQLTFKIIVITLVIFIPPIVSYCLFDSKEYLSVWVVFWMITCFYMILIGLGIMRFVIAFIWFFYEVILGDKNSIDDYFTRSGECVGDAPLYARIGFIREKYGYSYEHPYDENLC